MTVAGMPLTATTNAPGIIMLTNVKGSVATVTIADAHQSDGVIHVIDQVLLPGWKGSDGSRDAIGSLSSPDRQRGRQGRKR